MSRAETHAFEPRTEPVGAPGGGKDAATGWVYVELPPNPYLCRHCGLAEAAHERSLGGVGTAGGARPEPPSG